MQNIPSAPQGLKRLKWLGPAFIWMLSAAGSGELLFTPRIASQYGYTLIWAMLIAVLMKWFINREIGRYTVCTGATFFRGLASLKNKTWLLWLIIVPQLIVAVATIGGLAGATATAVVLLWKMPLWVPVVVLTLASALIVSIQAFRKIEKITTILAIIVSLSVLTAAIAAGPDVGKMAEGLSPKFPPNVKFDEVLPWIGFILAGAAGMMWFSYWTAAKGYGAASLHPKEPLETTKLTPEQTSNLKRWISHMSIANTLAVAGALIVALAFLILGTELLLPKGLVPEENKVAEVLGQLLGGIWGQFGFWFMISAVFITFMSTILSDQDGFGRMFADGAAILSSKLKKKSRWSNYNFSQRFFVWILLGLLPIIIYLVAGEPVALLKLAGVIEASHIPIVTGLILYLNKKSLPKQLQPSAFTIAATFIAGSFFAIFAVVYIMSLAGVIEL